MSKVNRTLKGVRRSYTIALRRYYLQTSCMIQAELRKADLKYYEEEIAEVGDLTYLLETLFFPRSSGCYNTPYGRDREIQAPCREVEIVEHLNIASLLIEAYHFLETESLIAMAECRYDSLDDMDDWSRLNKAFKNAIYGVMLRADFSLASLWRKEKISWQDLSEEIDKKRLTL